MIVIRLALTALLVVLAVFGITYMWTTYFQYPWTRDAHVRADIVELASRVSGTVIEVNVLDNDAVVAGDIILRIDPTDYDLAVQNAQAGVAQAQANADIAVRQAERDEALLREGSTAIAEVTVENDQLAAQAALATLEGAKAMLATAEADLERTVVRAPVNGYITNLLVRRGDYAQAGTALLAFVDSSSFRIEAFFMETKLPSIPIGTTARVKLMSDGRVLEGRVRGVARAVFESQATSQALLQDPEDSFEWIRLARRIPVTVMLENLPDDVELISGQTATVIVDGGQRTGLRGFGDRLSGIFGG